MAKVDYEGVTQLPDWKFSQAPDGDMRIEHCGYDMEISEKLILEMFEKWKANARHSP